MTVLLTILPFSKVKPVSKLLQSKLEIIEEKQISPKLSDFGKGNFQVFSAGSNPAGYVHPMSIKTLEKSGIFKTDYKSQSWDEFSDIDFDLVITVCNNASSEACPVYLSNAPKVHWGVEDPA